MAKLILLGRASCSQEEKFFIQNLSRRFSLSAQPDPDAKIYLAQTGRSSLSDLQLPKQAMVIVNAEDRSILYQLAQIGAQAITCGLSCKDTFTFSSKSEENAVVSLMRAIPNTAGRILEPMDIPVVFPQGIPDYPLLACTAALILAGFTGDKTIKFFQS